MIIYFSKNKLDNLLLENGINSGKIKSFFKRHSHKVGGSVILPSGVGLALEYETTSLDNLDNLAYKYKDVLSELRKKNKIFSLKEKKM